ncbi:hypothetical protein FACS189496_4000 [Bacilli bacterium]|nr:hypothetical protein FACS189496_4000 [Bacilli bacterium]
MLEIKTASKDSLVYKFNEENCMLMQKDANGVPLVKEIDGKRKT